MLHFSEFLSRLMSFGDACEILFICTIQIIQVREVVSDFLRTWMTPTIRHTTTTYGFSIRAMMIIIWMTLMAIVITVTPSASSSVVMVRITTSSSGGIRMMVWLLLMVIITRVLLWKFIWMWRIVWIHVRATSTSVATTTTSSKGRRITSAEISSRRLARPNWNIVGTDLHLRAQCTLGLNFPISQVANGCYFY
jgi:hypothetical protein